MLSGMSRAAGLQGVRRPARKRFLLNAMPRGWSFPHRWKAWDSLEEVTLSEYEISSTAGLKEVMFSLLNPLTRHSSMVLEPWSFGNLGRHPSARYY